MGAPSISEDGRFVAYTDGSKVFMRDNTLDSTVDVTEASNALPVGKPVMARDGSAVAYSTFGPLIGMESFKRWDRVSGATTSGIGFGLVIPLIRYDASLHFAWVKFGSLPRYYELGTLNYVELPITPPATEVIPTGMSRNGRWLSFYIASSGGEDPGHAGVWDRQTGTVQMDPPGTIQTFSPTFSAAMAIVDISDDGTTFLVGASPNKVKVVTNGVATDVPDDGTGAMAWRMSANTNQVLLGLNATAGGTSPRPLAVSDRPVPVVNPLGVSVQANDFLIWANTFGGIPFGGVDIASADLRSVVYRTGTTVGDIYLARCT